MESTIHVPVVNLEYDSIMRGVHAMMVLQDLTKLIAEQAFEDVEVGDALAELSLEAAINAGRVGLEFMESLEAAVWGVTGESIERHIERIRGVKPYVP